MLSKDVNDETTLHGAEEPCVGSWLLEQFHTRVKKREVRLSNVVSLYLNRLARRNAALITRPCNPELTNSKYCEQLDIRNRPTTAKYVLLGFSR